MNTLELKSELSFIEYAVEIKKAETDTIKFEIPIDAARLQKLLNKHQKIPLWLDYGEITPLALNYPKQLDLLGHSNEPVLIVKIGGDDSFYLFKLKQYSISDDMFYGRDQKHLIEKCLIIYLTKLVNSGQTEKEQFDKYFQVSKNQLFKLNQLNDELMVVKRHAETHLNSLFNYILKDIRSANQIISLSDSTTSYLNESNFDLETLEKIAIEAYHTANELSPYSTDLRIKRYFLPEIKEKQSNSAPISPPLPIAKSPKTGRTKANLGQKPKTTLTKLQKTMNLLDRYENAVTSLTNAKLPIMGKNIAQFCVPPISAPALTDSINKHAHRIKECLALYSENWPNLRMKYLPIQKLEAD